MRVYGTYSFICVFFVCHQRAGAWGGRGESSVHSEETLFHVVENEFAVYKGVYADHKYIVGGDFNSYTSINPDFIQFDSASYVIHNDECVEGTG